MIYKETVSIKYFEMDKVSVTGFCNFCKINLPLILAVSIMSFFTYGIKLIYNNIGLDTELFMADKAAFLDWHIQTGRFGLSLLSKLLFINEFNPFTAFFIAFCLIWFFTVSWCYIISIFNKDIGRNNKLIPFALIFMTMPIWGEMFYFSFMAAETTFIISLCPYVIYLLYKGFLDHEKRKIVSAFILLVFIISVYQAIVSLFCCGIFACFLLLQEKSDYKPQIYRNLCLKLFITLVCAIIVYFIIDRIVFPIIFHIEKSSYLDDMIKWGQKPIKENIYDILLFGFRITIGYISFLQKTDSFRNILLLPITLLFLIQIIITIRKTIPTGRRILYMLAGTGIPLSIILFTILGGSGQLMRTLFALPLAFAFMFFYLQGTMKKNVSIIIALLALLTATHQAQITTQLFYSDQTRYNEDVRLAYEINNLIELVQPDNERLPVVLVGTYNPALKFTQNFLQGQVLGHSIFEWNFPDLSAPTRRGLAFMKSLGFNFDIPDDDQLYQAHKEALLMPTFPNPLCAKRSRDFIVVKISDTFSFSNIEENKE